MTNGSSGAAIVLGVFRKITGAVGGTDPDSAACAA